jgi:CDP-ribitol ribitolphosphotransferase
MTGLVVRIRIWLVRAGHLLGRLRPMRRRVLLATSHADRIGGNLAFIRDELARTAPGVEVVTLAHRARRGWRGRLEGAIQAVRAGWSLARARLVVLDDYYFPVYAVRPRGGSTIVQTWHASGAFKKFGHSVGPHSFGADRALTDRVRIHANYDLCLVGSRASAPQFAEALGVPIERIVSHLGIPRTDLFFDEPTIHEAVADLRSRVGLGESRRVILYAPTFRGDRVTDARHRDDLDLALLHRVVGDDHVVLVRLHPFVRSAVRIGPELAGFVVDASGEPDINRLMLVSDVMITDYSSAIFEFALLGRPIGFFAPDLDAYQRERGFYFDYRATVPGPVFTETDELATWLRDGPFDTERVRAFAAASFDVADGRASRRFVDEVVLPALDPPIG